MQIRFLGAAGEVTGSMHLLETAHGSVLVDCGMFQGRREEAKQRNRQLPSQALSARALLLTHAHIDHAGSVPTLVKRGFVGKVFATPATGDLCSYLLLDSAHIQEADANYLNRKFGDEPGWQEIQPLYDEDDAKLALERFDARPYDEEFEVLPGVRATFRDAGHILGSAEIVVEVAAEAGGPARILFSGDLGRKNLPILRDPEVPPRPFDYILMESTYGDRVHDDIASMNDELARVIGDTVRRGGQVIVPAFAVGRTQELIYALHQLKHEGRLPNIPVYIDSPLSVKVTEVFRRHPECFDAETRSFARANGAVFSFAGAHFITTREESMRLNQLRQPAVIIASSGMCEAGRVLHHLRNHIEDQRCTILIVGFQAQHTLGRRLVERRPRVRILGMEHDVAAHVHVMNGFSAHADKRELREFALACGQGAKRVFLVHGEPAQQEPLRATLENDGLQVAVPARGEVFAL